jgi:ethanolamine transporter EutH
MADVLDWLFAVGLVVGLVAVPLACLGWLVVMGAEVISLISRGWRRDA